MTRRTKKHNLAHRNRKTFAQNSAADEYMKSSGVLRGR